MEAEQDGRRLFSTIAAGITMDQPHAGAPLDVCFLLRYGSPLLENLLYPSSAASPIFRALRSQNMAGTIWQRSRGSNPPCLRSPDHLPLGWLVLHWTVALMALSLKIQASSISTARQGKLVVISLFSAQSTSARSVGRPPKRFETHQDRQGFVVTLYQFIPLFGP